MPIHKLNQGKITSEMTNVMFVSPEGPIKQIIEKYFISPATNSALLIWEWFSALIFSHDGFGLQTKDGYIIKLKDQ